MIVCLYGAACSAFVEPVAFELQSLGREMGIEISALTIEAALSEPWRWRSAERLYVLPFEVPARLPDETEFAAAAAFLAAQEKSYAIDGKADARELALADFCQVLFGLNEFVYVE